MNHSESKIKGSLLFFLLIVLFVPMNVVFADVKEGLLAEEITDYIVGNKPEIAGMATILIEDDVIYEWMEGFADIENGIVVDEHTVFEWGSISKVLIWISIFQLVEANKVNLDTDIGTYLPGDFQLKRTFAESITLRHLMNHTAGFDDSYTDLFVPVSTSLPSLKEVLEEADITQVFPPGEIVAYSNYGASLAAYVVEEVSGLDYREYVRKHIFDPLAMDKTAIDLQQNDNVWVKKQRKLTQGYTGNLQLIESYDMIIPLYPSGSVMGTATDLQKLLQALLSENGVPLFQDERTIEQFFHTSLVYPNTELSRIVNGLFSLPSTNGQAVGHGGNTISFSSSVYLDRRKGIGVLVLTNVANDMIFTLGIPEVVFGKYIQIENEITLENSAKWAGVYESARAPYDGFSKIYRLFLRSKAEPVNSYDIMMNDVYYSQVEPGVFVTKDDYSAYAIDVYSEHPHYKNVLSAANTDLLSVPYFKHVLEWAGIILATFALLFSLGFVIVSTMTAIRKRRVRKVLMIQHSLHILLFLNVAWIVNKALSMTTYTAVKPFLIGNILYVVVSLILTSIILWQIKRGENALLIRFATIVSTIILCANIVYWEFYV